MIREPEEQSLTLKKNRDRRVLPGYPEALLTIISTLSLLAQLGFRLEHRLNTFFDIFDLLLAGAFAVRLGLQLHFARKKSLLLRNRALDVSVLVLALAGILLIWINPATAEAINERYLHYSSLPQLQLGLVKLYLFGSVFLNLLRGIEKMLGQNVRPEWILAGSFGILIFFGTLLLLLPRATPASAPPLSFTDALFTSTSASCVTGLAVLDTGSGFSTFGQIIILALIQIGGLGIIMFVAFLSVTSARSLPVAQMTIFRQIMNAPDASDLKPRIIGVMVFTFMAELIGAVSLFIFLSETRPEQSAGRAVFWSIFHSISAFCNAGFALQADGLEGYVASPGINFTIMGLIILGGIGFLVIPELLAVWLRRASGVLRTSEARKRELFVRKRPRLSIQSRLTIVVSLNLIVLGAVGFFLMERNHLLAEFSWSKAGLVSLFQSVSPRTAGFNTIPIGDLRDSTLLLMIILMVIGASPVSAGGGIKTVTFGILLLALRSMILSRDRVEVYGRTVPFKTLIAALSVFVLYSITAVVTTLLIAVFEPGFQMRDHLFESISALSTVGLSTGITSHLSDSSKVVLCAAMFIGRIGPISMALSVFRARHYLDYDLPPEEVVVG